jgi:hypothetical protein
MRDVFKIGEEVTLFGLFNFEVLQTEVHLEEERSNVVEKEEATEEGGKETTNVRYHIHEFVVLAIDCRRFG